MLGGSPVPGAKATQSFWTRDPGVLGAALSTAHSKIDFSFRVILWHWKNLLDGHDSGQMREACVEVWQNPYCTIRIRSMLGRVQSRTRGEDPASAGDWRAWQVDVDATRMAEQVPA